MTPVALLCLSLSLFAADGAPAPGNAARAEALFNRALGQTAIERSVPLLVEAVRLCPHEARYWVALGDACTLPTAGPDADLDDLDLGDGGPALSCVGGARAIYERGAKSAPESPLPLLRLAELSWDDDPRTAAAYLEKARVLDPANAYPLYLMALLRFNAGDDAGACRILDGARACTAFRYPVVMPTQPMEALNGIACVAVLAGRLFPQYARMRDLARNIVRVAEAKPAPPIGQPDAGVALLLEGQRLGYRLMHSEPTILIGTLVGIAVDAISTKSLEKRLAARTDTTSVAFLARVQERSRRRDALRERTKQIMGGIPLLELPTQPFRVFADESEKLTKVLKESGLAETAADQ